MSCWCDLWFLPSAGFSNHFITCSAYLRIAIVYRWKSNGARHVEHEVAEIGAGLDEWRVEQLRQKERVHGGREGVVLAHELGLRVARRVHEHVVGVEHQGELVAREEVRRGRCALW